MYYAYDVNGYVDDFVTTTTINDIKELSKKQKLKALTNLFDDGYSIDIKGLVADIDKGTWPDVGMIRQSVGEIRELFQKCKEMVILHEAYE